MAVKRNALPVSGGRDPGDCTCRARLYQPTPGFKGMQKIKRSFANEQTLVDDGLVRCCQPDANSSPPGAVGPKDSRPYAARFCHSVSAAKR